MAYSVKTVARMSGVSVRTLHFYDEAELLKPAYRSANGYRYYEERELHILQQILFYRELGFELNQIKLILAQSNHDRIAILQLHRKKLCRDLARTRTLIETIDSTVAYMKGMKKMKGKEFFDECSAEQQAKHEQYLITRFGKPMEEAIAQSKKQVKDWTKADWEKSGKAFSEICQDLARLLQKRATPDCETAQAIIDRHYRWICQFWTPNKDSYIGHGKLILDSDLRKAYEPHHAELPEFVAAGIEIYAHEKLS